MMKNKNMSAYIAGVIDGDGYIAILANKNNPNRFTYRAYVSVDGTVSVLPYFLKDLFGGSICHVKPRVGKDGSARKEYYSWRLSSMELCSQFINPIIPYLKGKKEEAILLKDLIDSSSERLGNDEFTLEQRMYRENLFIKMKLLKSHVRNVGDINKYLNKDKSAESKDLHAFWCYMAGMMDTDGSFSIGKTKVKSGNSKKEVVSLCYKAFILLTLTNPAPIAYVMENFPKALFMNVRAKSTRQGFCYRIEVKKHAVAIEFLESIIPYMIVKKAAAEKLLEFLRNYTRCYAGTNKDIVIAENKKREVYYQELASINKYGVYKPSLIDLEFLPDDAGDNKAEPFIGTVNVASEKGSF